MVQLAAGLGRSLLVLSAHRCFGWGCQSMHCTSPAGSTYPKDPTAEFEALRQATVAVSNSEREGVSVFRRLHGASEAWLMTAGISD